MVHLTRAYYVASVTQNPMLVDAGYDASDASSDAFASLCVTLRQNIFALCQRAFGVPRRLYFCRWR